MNTMLRRWLAYQPPRGQFGWTVLVITVPILLLMLIGLVGGNADLGTPELTGIVLIWVIGLTLVWVVPLVRHMVSNRP